MQRMGAFGLCSPSDSRQKTSPALCRVKPRAWRLKAQCCPGPLKCVFLLRLTPTVALPCYSNSIAAGPAQTWNILVGATGLNIASTCREDSDEAIIPFGVPSCCPFYRKPTLLYVMARGTVQYESCPVLSCTRYSTPPGAALCP